MGAGRNWWNSCLELCLLGGLIIETECLELEQACITAVGGSKGDRGLFSCKGSLSRRQITWITVLTVDLGNSRHRLIMLVHLCDGHATNGKRARKRTINDHMEGRAKGCYCQHSWLERSETGSSHQTLHKIFGSLYLPEAVLSLAFHTGQHATLSSMGKQRLQNWLVSMRSDLCLRGLCSLKMTSGYYCLLITHQHVPGHQSATV